MNRVIRSAVHNCDNAAALCAREEGKKPMHRVNLLPSCFPLPSNRHGPAAPFHVSPFLWFFFFLYLFICLYRLYADEYKEKMHHII
jgi:hypothetical protein